MEAYKLKIRIGDNEFEAEGPVEQVQAQFAAFKELIASAPPKAPQPQSGQPAGVQSGLALSKIMSADDRVVSLTARAESVDDAALLVLLGQRTFRNNDSATGGEIMDGLRQSGYTLGRVDRTLNELATAGSVITIGTGRSRRYRLTNQGMIRAQEIAQRLIALVP